MNGYIRDLDDALAANGEPLVLRRTVGTVPPINIDVEIVGRVRGVVRRDLLLASGISQDYLEIIMSPTQILEAQWPGGGVDTAEPYKVDRSYPRKGDKIIRNGSVSNIELVQIIKVENEAVKFIVLVKGNASGS